MGASEVPSGFRIFENHISLSKKRFLNIIGRDPPLPVEEQNV